MRLILDRAQLSNDGGVEREVPEPVVDSEHIRWDFRGEYWRDELDSYLFKIASECPAEEAAEE